MEDNNTLYTNSMLYKEQKKNSRLMLHTMIFSWICILGLITSLLFLIPLKEKTPFLLYLDKNTQKIESLVKVTDIENYSDVQAVRDSLVRTYIYERESYNYYTIKKQYINVGAYSSESVFKDYDQVLVSSTNSIFNTLANKYAITIKVLSLQNELEEDVNNSKLYTAEIILEKTVYDVLTNSEHKKYKELVKMTYFFEKDDTKYSKETIEINPLRFTVKNYLKTTYDEK